MTSTLRFRSFMPNRPASGHDAASRLVITLMSARIRPIEIAPRALAAPTRKTHVNPNQTLGSSKRFDPTGGIPANPTPNNGHEQNQRTGSRFHKLRLGKSRHGACLSKRVAATATGGKPTSSVTAAWMAGIGPLRDLRLWSTSNRICSLDRSLVLKRGNIWAAADHDVYAGPFDPKYDRLFRLASSETFIERSEPKHRSCGWRY